MSDQENRKIVEEYMNAWASGDASQLERALDPSYKFNAPPGFSSDKKGALEMSKQYHDAFPDMKLTCTNWVIQGDQVALRAVATGTHKGEFMGIAPTNRKAEVTGLALVKVRNGKIVDDISEFDLLGLLTKIGAIPPFGETQEPETRHGRLGAVRVPGKDSRKVSEEQTDTVPELGERRER